MALTGHSMVPLGFGQAILGGHNHDTGNFAKKIYFITCSQCKNAQSWKVSTLKQELKVPRKFFVAIPIPDQLAGCIPNSEFFYCYSTIRGRPLITSALFQPFLTPPPYHQQPSAFQSPPPI